MGGGKRQAFEPGGAVEGMLGKEWREYVVNLVRGVELGNWREEALHSNQVLAWAERRGFPGVGWTDLAEYLPERNAAAPSADFNLADV